MGSFVGIFDEKARKGAAARIKVFNKEQSIKNIDVYLGSLTRKM